MSLKRFGSLAARSQMQCSVFWVTISGLYPVSLIWMTVKCKIWTVDRLLLLFVHNDYLYAGTPVNTSLNDLKNQIKFIGVQDGESMFKNFNESVCRHVNAPPVRRNDEPDDDAKALPCLGHFTFFMRSVILRRSQKQTYRPTSTTLMSLPPKVLCHSSDLVCLSPPLE
jgi:hypothetical protein